jgi:hypothetical protein
MQRSIFLLIALAASVMVCVQNSLLLTAFTWAIIHGAGLESAFAFGPAVIGLAVIWAAFWLIKPKVSKHAAASFAALALGVVLLNELLLPATPLQAWRHTHGLKGVRVLEVRDEPFLSPRGNPIGIRISFDAVVPRTAAYSISVATLMKASGETIWPLHFAYSPGIRVEPPPVPQAESPYDIFQKDVVYRFSQDMMPAFIRYDEKTKTVCLAEVRTKYITEADFLSALAANRDIGLHVEIHVNGEFNSVSMVAAEGVTSHHYDMQTIYDTIGKEGAGRCQQ